MPDEQRCQYFLNLKFNIDIFSLFALLLRHIRGKNRLLEWGDTKKIRIQILNAKKLLHKVENIKIYRVYIIWMTMKLMKTCGTIEGNWHKLLHPKIVGTTFHQEIFQSSWGEELWSVGTPLKMLDCEAQGWSRVNYGVQLVFLSRESAKTVKSAKTGFIHNDVWWSKTNQIRCHLLVLL